MTREKAFNTGKNNLKKKKLHIPKKNPKKTMIVLGGKRHGG